ncbi:MAG: DUF115 domain-containing protein [Alphaproteobacteria bacterium]|nr:DUF115 domain-containing protein [Alphaproteobacteria bacterium]
MTTFEPGAPAVARNPVATETLHAQVRAAAARDLPQIGLQPAHGDTMAIVGGGPSLRQTDILSDLKMRPARILALNGAHDFLIGRGIVPWGLLVYDPRADVKKFVEKPRDNIVYFIASQCHGGVFEALAGRNVVLWHARVAADGEDLLRDIYGPDGKWCLVAGGTTVGTRAIYVGMALGFRRFHLYGLDGCISEDGASHAYDQSLRSDAAEERMTVTVGGRDFIVSRWMRQQALDFVELLQAHGDTIDITIHGGGLLAALLERHRESH